MTKATKAKRPTKLDQLMVQGRFVVGEIDGQKVPYFAMPTPELQIELSEESMKKIKKDLKANGYELLHATRREHPFHSAVLRKKVDKLARDVTIVDKAGIWSRLYLPPAEAWKQLKEHHADWPEGMKAFRAIWAKGYEELQYNNLFPPNDPELTVPRPKPVFFNEGSEIVLSVLDGFVHLYVKVALLTEA